LKNGPKSRFSDCRDKTPSRGTRHEQLHHEQNSCYYLWGRAGMPFPRVSSTPKGAMVLSSKDNKVMVCEHCGTVDQPAKRRPGSTAVSVVCLVFGLVALAVVPLVGILFLLAWVGYGVWRLASTKRICTSCGRHDALLSPESPRGKRIIADFSTPPSPTVPR
jgi:hypothetical protein